MANAKGSKIKSWLWGNKEFVISVTFSQHLRGLPSQKLYSGIDVDLSMGTPLYAPYDGTAYQSSRQSDGAEVITLSHGTHYTQYAHLKQRKVVKGAKVKQGQLIGYSGNTGFSSAPHLHFALINSTTYDGKKRVDPYDYLLKVPNPKPTPAPAPVDPCRKEKEEISRLKQEREVLRETLHTEATAHKHFADRADKLLKKLGEEERKNEIIQNRMTETLIIKDTEILRLEGIIETLSEEAEIWRQIKRLIFVLEGRAKQWLKNILKRK